MSENQNLINKLYSSIGEKCAVSPDIAHIEIHGNEVLGAYAVKGLIVEADSKDNMLYVNMKVEKNIQIKQPIRVCFGMLEKSGKQHIKMNLILEENSGAAVMAACTFPNAIDVVHTMDAEITIGTNAKYAYYERHVHGEYGGVTVIPRTNVCLENNAFFNTDFEVIKGRAGKIDLEYIATCKSNSVLSMNARISGRKDDMIKIHEKALLEGKNARGVLTTNIAVQNNAQADIQNTIIASAPYATGHVDCKEIIRDNAVARAVPIVEVRDPKAHVTHEAALGSVDSKQLQTLMSRGLSDEDATDLIIEGMLQPKI